jgi:hypothetical protein
MRLFLKYAKERVCVIRSLKIALIVGTILAFLNHYDSIFSGTVDATGFFQIIITYAVPYSVATFGSAMQARHMDLAERQRKSETSESILSGTPVGSANKAEGS